VKRKIVMDCLEATRLVQKKEEQKLSWVEGARLYYHLMNCSLCRDFAIQSRRINVYLSSLRNALFTAPPFRIDPAGKEQMRKKLQEIMKK
jgi:predicted anti-sigma-YlaC factor YlaD